MKHTSGPRRGRPRGNGKRFSSGKHGSVDSSGSEAKVRGSAQQVHEKYLALARDAVSAGDRIGAENYFQFADHYYRVFNASNTNANGGNGGNSGGGNGRGDRNDKVPPPPPSAVDQIVVGEAGAVPVARAAEMSVAEPGKPDDQPNVAPEPAAPTLPESQAEELAVALAKAKTDDDAPAAEPEDKPKRVRRSPLRTGLKRTSRGRPPKTDEADGTVSDQPAPVEVKPVRRRVRKAAPKDTDEGTPKSVPEV